MKWIAVEMTMRNDSHYIFIFCFIYSCSQNLKKLRQLLFPKIKMLQYLAQLRQTERYEGGLKNKFRFVIPFLFFIVHT